jgi:hypothetical protein
LARSTGPQRNSNDPSTRGAAQGNGIGNNSQPKAAVNNPPQSGESNSKLKKEGLQLKRVLVVSSLVGLGAWAFKIYYWDQKYEYQRDISVAA